MPSLSYMIATEPTTVVTYTKDGKETKSHT